MTGLAGGLMLLIGDGEREGDRDGGLMELGLAGGLVTLKGSLGLMVASGLIGRVITGLGTGLVIGVFCLLLRLGETILTGETIGLEVTVLVTLGIGMEIEGETERSLTPGERLGGLIRSKTSFLGSGEAIAVRGAGEKGDFNRRTGVTGESSFLVIPSWPIVSGDTV